LQFNSTVDAIIAANNLNADALIFVGEQLMIPVFAPIPATPTLIASPTPTSISLGSTATTAPLVTQTPTTIVPGLGGPTVNGIGTYIVQPGETLSSIAARYGTSFLALARLNGIVNPQLIEVGQVIAVPGPGNNAGYAGNTGAGTPVGTPTGYPTPYPTVTIPPTPPPVVSYTVRTGDTLFSIAAHYHVTIGALVNANNISNAGLIYVGQTLVIPVQP
jgi:LysM repeat protein